CTLATAVGALSYRKDCSRVGWDTSIGTPIKKKYFGRRTNRCPDALLSVSLSSAYELDNRQNAKYLPFPKLQPPKKIKGFYILSHSLPSRTRPVLFFWSRIGHVEISKTKGAGGGVAINC